MGDLTLETPGLDGVAELHVGGAGAVRGPAVDGDQDAVFARHFIERGVVELRQLASVGVPPEGDDRPLVTVEGPETDADEEQVALIQNEDGSLSWHFPAETQTHQPAVRRGGDRRTFHIRLDPAEPPVDAATTRGPIGFLGTKILKILGFDAAGAAGAGIVRRWEKKRRPHRLREFLPQEIQKYDVGNLARERWDDLTKGPALLFIHGTNSQIHSGFHALPPPELELIHRRYDRRVIAFDHPTVGWDPVENVAALNEMVPDGTRAEVDIVCHSRGGLVARELAENSSGDSPVRVRNVVFVATPNAGTVLADSAHIKDFLDTYTNFMSLLPPIGFLDILETIATVAKDVALNVHARLRGLQSMNPRGDYLARLNKGAKADASYFAVAADYEPLKGHAFPLWLRDRLFDAVFVEEDKKVKNDLVVPTEGVFGANSNGNFPVRDVCSFISAEGMHHSGFFDHKRVLDFLHEQLPG